jgi:hypothetical protein
MNGSWVSSIVTSALAVGATIWISRRYYLRAGEDLVREAAELRRLTTILLGGLEAARIGRSSGRPPPQPKPSLTPP